MSTLYKFVAMVRVNELLMETQVMAHNAYFANQLLQAQYGKAAVITYPRLVS